MDHFVLNVKHCYPIYTLDYSEKVESLIKYIANFENAISIGRQGLYRYNNMDHSIKMGLMTAEHILNELPKIDIFNIASEKTIFDWQDPGK
jgi:UDP-galactopyranose mutase